MCTPPPPKFCYGKVELVWPGKTTEVERVSLPFQTIERVNEVSRSAAGQARLRDGGELPDWWPEGLAQQADLGRQQVRAEQPARRVRGARLT